MAGIVPDNDLEGQFESLLQRLTSETWGEEWGYLGVTVYSLETLGLARDSSDREIWEVCQKQQVVLITGNRNDDGPDSLESTIRQNNTPESLPVFTLANAARMQHDRSYAERVVERLLEYLFDLEKCRGTGRLYLP